VALLADGAGGYPLALIFGRNLPNSAVKGNLRIPKSSMMSSGTVTKDSRHPLRLPTTHKEPTISLRGLLAKYGTAPSAEEID
jgi:hypothetical protein